MLHTDAGILRRRPRHIGNRPFGATDRHRVAIAVAVLALVVPLTLTTTAATAAPAAPAAPGGTDQVESSEEEPPPPTTLIVDPSGFSGTGYAVISGTRQIDSSVTVTAGGREVCVDPPDGTTTFRCGSVQLPDGAAIDLRAAETREDASSPVPTAASALIDVLRPPVLDGTGAFITTGLISGTARPGTSVTVSVDAVVDAGCTSIPVPSSTFWSCNLAAGSGSYAIRAQQSDARIAGGRASGFSAMQQVTVDRDVPASAIITAPASGARIDIADVTVSGTGEEGAAVDVYADDVPACSTRVIGGRWSCGVAGLTRGLHQLQAVLRDAAGNYASPGEAISILVAAPRDGADSVAPPAPIAPDAPDAPTQSPDGVTPEPVPESEAPSEAPDPGARGQVPTSSSWSAPTGFGIEVVSFADALRGGTWSTAGLIGLLFVALIAIPLRMLASSLRGRISRLQLTGRNRAHVRERRPDAGSEGKAWLEALVPIAVAAGFIVLGVGVAGEVRYLRLFIAIGLALAVLNIAAATAVRLATRSVPEARLRLVPPMLLAAAGTALLSRWTGLEPPVVAGVLMGAAFATVVPARVRAMAGLALIGAVTASGVAGWMLLGVVRSADGFWGAFATEALATLCLAGLGSALVLVIPVASLPGRAVLDWSPPAWVATTLIIATVVSAVMLGDVSANLNALPWLLTAAAFAALCVATWAFVRFVEPQTRG